MCGFLCCSKSSVKIQESPLQTSIKNMCISCSVQKNIITLVCNHKYCVKCYTKNKYCIECDKKNSRKKNMRNWCWCCY